MKNTPVILAIDTSGIRDTNVSLTVGAKTYTRHTAEKLPRSQTVLPFIAEVLREANLPLSAVTEITVNTGPGSYTGLRVGITVANTLATLLAVPVNGKKTLAVPTYS
jgi:tRNA threonylcarbamoyladenosine biosynthesis protein TsaB